jgi:GNAT superfamily N-acetyltransferase
MSGHDLKGACECDACKELSFFTCTEVANVEAVNSITVTVADRDDLHALVASVTGLFREDGGKHDAAMDVSWPDREGPRYYGGLLASETCLLAVARDGVRVVGHLVGKLQEPDSMRTQRFAELESLRVDPDHRKSGIGGMLVDYFFQWARQRGARQASVSAFAANEDAVRLYGRLGFVPMTVTMRAVL